MISPRICARAHGHKAVPALTICEGVAAASEIRIEWRVVLIVFVQIASSGVGLPNFHEGMGKRAAIFIEYTTTNYYSFADRFAGMLAGEIASFHVDVFRPK